MEGSQGHIPARAQLVVHYLFGAKSVRVENLIPSPSLSGDSMIWRRSEGTAKGETLRRYTQDPFPRGSYNLNVPLFRAATLSLRTSREIYLKKKMCVILETLRFGLEDSTWWKGRGAEGRHLETVPWKGGREEMGSGEPLTVFGEEKREEKTIGFGSMITRCKNRSLVDYIWKGVMEIR